MLVAGAGVAGLETMVALRGLAPEAVAPTLVAPEEAFALRALTVYEAAGHEPHPPLSDRGPRPDAGRRLSPRRDRGGRPGPPPGAAAVGSDGALRRPGRRRRRDHVPRVRPRHALRSSSYGRHRGAPSSPTSGRGAFGRPRSSCRRAAPGRSRPTSSPSCSMRPLRGGSRSRWSRPSAHPLTCSARRSPEMIRAEFAEAGIELLCGASAQVPSARIVETGHGHRLRVDRILHLPGVTGPRIAGLPCDRRRLHPGRGRSARRRRPRRPRHRRRRRRGVQARRPRRAAGRRGRPGAGCPRRRAPRAPAVPSRAPSGAGHERRPALSARRAPGRRRRERSSLRNACGGRRPRSPRTGSRRGSPRSIPRRPTTRRRRADRGRREATAVEPRRGHARRHP